MKCKRFISLRKIEEKSESIFVSEVAKNALSFLTSHNIPLTPRNYEEWFFVICKAKEEKHLLTEQNLFLLYEEYIKEKPKILNDYDAKEVSKELKDVVNDSENIISMIDKNIDKHGKYIKQSKTAIKEQNTTKIDELYKKIDELEKENKKLRENLNNNRKKLDLLEDKFIEFKKLSYKDALTGLLNRRAFYEELKRLANAIQFSIIFLDIDDFKKINDTYGHLIGDEVLKEVGAILENFIRKDTKAFRIGGEEFVIILPNVDENISFKVAERIRKVIENNNVKEGENIIKYTASFGVTSYKKNESIDDMLNRADKAMYKAKKSGKNRVVIL